MMVQFDSFTRESVLTTNAYVLFIIKTSQLRRSISVLLVVGWSHTTVNTRPNTLSSYQGREISLLSRVSSHLIHNIIMILLV
jgi:hypothetical protein